MKNSLIVAIAAYLCLSGNAQASVAPVARTKAAPLTVTLNPSHATDTISRMIYGQFAEHLGGCVYGGIWVGEDSPIPNTKGYRNDALKALRDLQVPVLRWPGGCFADDYFWRDGIGPAEKRPTLINNNWGGTKEDNSFGTHEFLNLCEMLGIEPYVSGNMGSGTVGEMAQWVEYMTAPAGPLAEERAANGRKEPWHVKYFGVGNESWGCGGNMRPEYYADNFRRYNTYLRNQPDNKLYRIASGASDYDYNWTRVLMERIGGRMDALSLHYYTVKGWDGSKGSATEFDNAEYYRTIGKAVEIDTVVRKHIAIMDQFDPKKRTDLLVDEWGTWFDEEPGTIPGHLYQQNTMRDAMVAALTLNIFHTHADRVKMANIAQIANVLQAMWLTKDDKLILTPTYYVFMMYAPHKDAVAIPLSISEGSIVATEGERPYPALSATASRAADGTVTISLVNTLLDASREVTIPLPEGLAGGTQKADKKWSIVSAEILTAPEANAHNTFEAPETVASQQFTGAKIKSGALTLTMPPLSILSITLR